MRNEDRQFDLKIRSIMENGKEEVPDRVWDAVQQRLSALEYSSAERGKQQRRTVMSRLIYAAAGVAAAAAIAAAVIFTGPSGSQQGPDTLADAGNSGQAMTQPAGQSGGTGDNDIMIDVVPREESITGKDIDSISGQIAAIGLTAYVPEPMSESGMPGISAAADRTSAAGTMTDTGTGTAPEDNGSDTTADARTGTAPEDHGTGTTKGTRTATVPEVQETGSTHEDQKTGTASGITEAAQDEWAATTGTEERQSRRPEISLTVYGNALSNNSDGKSSRRPPIMQSPGVMKDCVVEDQAKSYGIPLSFGAGVKIAFTPRWALSAGINYTLLTRTLSGTYYDRDGSPNYDNSISNRQNYIGIPVNVYCNILSGDFVDFYAWAGGTVEKCVSDNYLVDVQNRELNWSKGSKGVQLSAGLGIGVEFILARRLGLYIDPSVRYYFESRQPKSIRTVQPLMFSFEAGLRVRL